MAILIITISKCGNAGNQGSSVEACCFVGGAPGGAGGVRASSRGAQVCQLEGWCSDARQKNHLNRKERRCATITIIREEVERLQARLNGRDAGELLDEIEAEGFEPLGWNLEVAFSTSSVIFFRCINISSQLHRSVRKSATYMKISVQKYKFNQ